jgi:hypothetical protein
MALATPMVDALNGTAWSNLLSEPLSAGGATGLVRVESDLGGLGLAQGPA